MFVEFENFNADSSHPRIKDVVTTWLDCFADDPLAILLLVLLNFGLVFEFG